ncbi:hypothetical protein BCR42DRAFT_347098 [Absidia repens]|uniref:BHLH domain-containing protein n=1 Tax=Absidia repens TaxID=90262 RepID=A0A1X2IQ72_9FUNG|nr:hypothetical protein BCR42DRAFT_347098 [Absidia repens]
MILSNHYSTPPHEDDQVTHKAMDYESLDPNSRILQPPNNATYRTQTNPSHYASPSPSNSRRGSMIDTSTRSSNQSSPPSSPSHTLNRPSPLEHRPDLISTPSSPLHLPWRRDSLPSISQLTGEMHSKQQQQQQQQQQQPFNLSPFHPTANNTHSTNHTPTMTRTRHTSSPASLLLEDAHLRRHSIAIAPTNHNHHQQQQHHPQMRRDSVSYPSSTTSSTCSSPHHEPRYDNYSTPPPPPTSLNGTSSTTTSYSTINNSGSIMSSPPSRRFSTQAPYSRSPELRVSHKLAERKRRKEMKDLFDDLRDLLPVDKGLKTSKWEILSKAVGYISHLHEREENFVKETEQLKRELMYLKRQ